MYSSYYGVDSGTSGHVSDTRYRTPWLLGGFHVLMGRTRRPPLIQIAVTVIWNSRARMNDDAKNFDIDRAKDKLM